MKKYNLPDASHPCQTVVLANGEFPTHPVPLSILNNCKYLVCCDGAINNLSQTGRTPDAIVGDCDSLSEENQRRYKDIIHRIAEQETNDLTKAINFCANQGKKKITILGATGKREDHTIANVSLLCEYIEYAEVEMITDYGIFNAINTSAGFASMPKQQVSLFSIDQQPVTTHNLIYPVTDRIFTNWWQATLNEAIGTEFVVETSGRVIVYRTFL